jgi:hypothetical protein
MPIALAVRRLMTNFKIEQAARVEARRAYLFARPARLPTSGLTPITR